MFRTSICSSSGVRTSSLQCFTVHLKRSLVADTTPVISFVLCQRLD